MKKFICILLLILTLLSGSILVHGYYVREITPEMENKIRGWMTADSKFQDLPRKSYDERVADCIEFYKQGGIWQFYNAYGLDIKDFRNKEDFFSWSDVNKYVINKERQNKHKYNNLANKDQFDAYLKEIAPDYIPKSFFNFKNGKVISENLFGTDFITAMSTINDGSYFFKQVDSDQGKGVFIIEKIGEKLSINKGEIDLNIFMKDIVNTNNTYILQEKITNHPDIAKFNPSTTNTIRIVTTHFNNNTHVLAATLRLGCRTDTWVDNASQGGTFVGIDDEKGTLKEWGYYVYGKGKTREKKHPVSHIEYNGYKIPYWKETLNLVKSLHDKIDYYTSIGWDIAITENGPKVIEMNIYWGHDVIQIPHGGLKAKWEQLKLAD